MFYKSKCRICQHYDVDDMFSYYSRYLFIWYSLLIGCFKNLFFFLCCSMVLIQFDICREFRPPCLF